MKTIFISMLLFTLFIFPSFGQQLDSQISEVENNLLPMNIFEGEQPYNLEERMEYYQVPGLSITVINNYEVVWTKYYGYADMELKIKVDSNTLFNVGSLSKGVASLTTLSLIQNGKLQLDDDVNKKLSSWEIPPHQWSDKTTITPLLLMNHSSGAMHHYGTIYTQDNLPTITQLLNGEPPVKERPTIIDREPGTEFLYSNPGFAILQQLLEDIENQPFFQIAQKEVFTPLQMTHTTFQQPLPPELLKTASAGNIGNKPLPVKQYFYANAAAGGLWSTTADFAKYVIELEKSYLGKSNRIISKELAQEMLSPHVSKQYGLGLFLRDMGSEKYFGHMGDNMGFFAGFNSHLTDGYGFIVFTNSNTSPELIREINKAVAKVYHWKEFLPEPIQTISLNLEQKKKYCGRFKVGSDEVLEIMLQDENLVIKNMDNEKLFYIGNETFKIKRRIGELIYQFEDDRAPQIKYHFADNIGRLSEDYKKGYAMDKNEYTPSELLEMGRIENAIEEYKKIFSNNPKDIAVSENKINRLGYSLLSNRDINAALAVLKLNTVLYPNSSNCYDSYAEALARNGETTKAIKNYQKAIELDNNAQNAKEQLKMLMDRE